jgi:hypothetical protein
MLLHDSPDFRDLVEITARDLSIDPGLVEKDYWIMHGLWALQQLGLRFELKGGTSLSKGYGLIHRFSEDIDILIHPDGALAVGRNHDKPAHIEARRAFYDDLASRLVLPGFVSVARDHAFDDGQMRSAGIRLLYPSLNPLPDGVKDGVLLEAGFDQVSPNRPCLITSWAFERATAAGVETLTDNRAHDVRCYEPGYTLVEKLQTIATKFRRREESGVLPSNFLRHYYDVYCLLGDEAVCQFIGTDAYHAHKRARFPNADDPVIARNPAFRVENPKTRRLFEAAYASTVALYYREQPPFDDLLTRIADFATRL